MITFLKSWLKIFAAVGYSLQGIGFALRSERAFQQEAFIGVPLIVYAIASSHTAIEKILLIGTVLIVWMVELLNTAIEATVARISLDIHPLSKVAKDTASAAVMMALLLAALTWGLILFQI